MASLSSLLWSISLLGGSWVLYSWWCLFQNYLIAQKVGVPIRILPISAGNPFWMVVDKRVLGLVKRVFPWTRRSNFVKYNWRGWEVDDRAKSHLELGDVFMLVTPGGNSLYVCNPDTLVEIFRRRGDFPRPLQLFEILNVYGPNLSTVEGQQWKKQRKITATCFNDQNSQLVWHETISQARDMIRYWVSRSTIRSTADDTRTLSLHVLSRAGFGKSFQFQGHEDEEQKKQGSSSELATSYKESLQIVLDNCVLIMALGTKFLAKPWLPARLKKVHEASNAFQKYMTNLYEEEKSAFQSHSEEHQAAFNGKKQTFGDSNLMTALVRASGDANENTGSTEDGGLTEKEIYGNMFVINFAGHDTTAHTLTFVFVFLAVNPAVQDWLYEEIVHVLGKRVDSIHKGSDDDSDLELDYQADFPRLKRCLAVMMETVRLYTPVPVAKWTDSLPQNLTINKNTITIPPSTMVLPSYAAIHTHPKYWGPDALMWNPLRWIAPATSLDDETMFVPQRGVFIPWSEGERSCPGKKFSQVEVVATLAVIFGTWKVEPVAQSNETLDDARKRVLHQIETDSAQVLLLQMLHPERAPLVWKKR